MLTLSNGPVSRFASACSAKLFYSSVRPSVEARSGASCSGAPSPASGSIGSAVMGVIPPAVGLRLLALGGPAFRRILLVCNIAASAAQTASPRASFSGRGERCNPTRSPPCSVRGALAAARTIRRDRRKQISTIPRASRKPQSINRPTRLFLRNPGRPHPRRWRTLWLLLPSGRFEGPSYPSARAAGS